MRKVIQRIKLITFIIILLEVALLTVFGIFYFNNLYNLKSLIDPIFIALGAIIIVFLNGIFLWIAILKVSYIRNKTDLKAAEVIGNDVQEAYNFAMIGLAVTDENGLVLWTNDLFKNRHIDIIDTNIYEWKKELVALKDTANTQSTKILINNRNYEVKFLLDAGLWIFKDTTDYEDIYKYSREQAPVIGLLSIDNYSDVVRDEDDINDSITKLKNALFNYAKEFGLLIRRHREDTYLILCNYESFKRMKEDHFSILNRAREISNDDEIPLTISIGVAYNFPDVVKLNELAGSALDIAMSRGGDQVVISSYGNDMEFIGGKTNAQESRNRVRTRILSDSLIALIKNASNVLIMGHYDMDMDALGACLGVKAICDRVDKKSKIIVDLKSTEVKTRAALVTQFSKDQLEEMTVNTNNAEEFIAPDTLLIVCDVHTPKMVMAPAILEKASKVVVIDHHRRAEDYIDSPVFNHIDPSASSTSEIITEFIKFCTINPKVSLEPIVASIMLSGIFLDTTYFKSKQTGVRTFEACTILKEYGADNALADDLLKDEYEEYLEVNQIIKTVYTPSYGVVYAMGDAEHIYEPSTIARAANTLLTMKGVHACFVFAKISSKQIRLSARSDGQVNVSILAEKLGGGGHYISAAAVFDKTDPALVEAQLKDVLDTYLPEAQADAKSRRNED